MKGYQSTNTCPIWMPNAKRNKKRRGYKKQEGNLCPAVLLTMPNKYRKEINSPTKKLNEMKRNYKKLLKNQPR